MQQSIVIGFNTQGVEILENFTLLYFILCMLVKNFNFEVNLTNYSVIEDLRAYITTLEIVVFFIFFRISE